MMIYKGNLIYATIFMMLNNIKHRKERDIHDSFKKNKNMGAKLW